MGENQTSANHAAWIIFIGQTGCYQCYRTFHALSRAVRSRMIRSIIAGSKWSVRQKWATSPLSEMWLIEDHQLWTRYQQQNVRIEIREKTFTRFTAVWFDWCLHSMSAGGIEWVHAESGLVWCDGEYLSVNHSVWPQGLDLSLHQDKHCGPCRQNIELFCLVLFLHFCRQRFI